VINLDPDGTARFAAGLANECELKEALDAMAENESLAAAVETDRAAVLDLYEQTFGHDAYTGRSGVMYGYEGLGCVYWHMVAKLLLATQESFFRARAANADDRLLEKLSRLYYRVRSGIGYEKSAAEFGAFPTDPYSHTPPDGGARQPGMTGQVKEEILTRFGELGVHVQRAALRFEPVLLRHEELLDTGRDFEFYGVDGNARQIPVPARSLAFTICQTPVVYLASDERWVEVVLDDGSSRRTEGSVLESALSREVFARSGRIREIRVGIRG
jgi:hypothetical protein